ncbi:MAG: penicillin-binding protein 2 [Zetaproteobacteria bacterium]|nr:MAG: penicillin-binding protein 2 [Zetaproteobacteria bacterium]
MRNGLDVRRRFNLRLLFFYAATLGFFGLILAHLADMQLVKHKQYLLQSDRNRINVVPVLPERGMITDVAGRGLAVNRVAYQVLMIPERVTRREQVLRRLAEMLHWDEARVARLRKRIAHSRADRPVLLADRLPWGQVAPLAARLHHFSGIDVQANSYRYYPYGALTSHVVGYISLATAEDVARGYQANEFVGRAGAERAFEARLHGTPGARQEEVDAHGRRVAVLQRIPPKTGENVHLSLDVDLQRVAADALGARTGAVVVMDVQTGKLLVLLSRPGYDTNRFITGLEYAQWNAWLRDVRKPLVNRTIQAAYPPASTFKLVTALAGLRHHIPLATGSSFCPGYLQLADRKLRCWRHQGHGRVDLRKAIMQSCDVYFYELGDQLGMGRLAEEARRWGFGEKTGIILSPEARGNIPRVGSGRGRWYRGVTMISAIGQGAVTATPLQVARFAAAIANGGRLLRPQLDADAAPVVERIIDVAPAALQRVREAMRAVVAERKGTAYYALRHLPWHVAGKTGTAQVVAMRKREAKGASGYDPHKDHAWFMGFAPYEQPRIAFAVFVEHGGHGGSAAAPVAAAIIRAMAAHADQQGAGT